MNSLGEDISGVNWTVTQCHAADFYEDVCQNGRIYWAYTLQKPGVHAIKVFITQKSMIAKKEEGEADEADEAKAIWVSFTLADGGKSERLKAWQHEQEFLHLCQM